MEISRGRLIGAGVGLLLLLLLYGARGREAAEHRENISNVRDQLLSRGCVRAGVPPENQAELAKCVETARERCRSAGAHDMEDCAAQAATGSVTDVPR